jgi:hypothetical protein
MEVRKLTNSPNYTMNVSNNKYVVTLVSPSTTKTVYVGQNVNFVWKVTDNGNPVVGGTVTMYLTGYIYSSTVGTGVTNSSGEATITYAFSSAGSIGIHASYNPPT